MTNLHKPLVLSGMQPTNTLHLGNYLGALKNWVRMQHDMPCLFCVVDMHAITVEEDPKELTRAPVRSQQPISPEASIRPAVQSLIKVKCPSMPN